MSKLVVKIRDDDKYFPHCPLHHEGYCHLPQTHYWQGNALYMQQCLGTLNKRPPWCPLKEEAVEVVRCKDCKFWKTNYMWNGSERKVCVIEAYEPVRNEDDYCSKGERK